MSPLYKQKGSKSSPTNYRPISLLSVVSKVQERVVHGQLYSHTAEHLPVGQSGYRPGDGTELQLARLVHEISEVRDNGNIVMSCFFDLSKAFDRVWHRGPLKKLKHFGVCEDALQWLCAYLAGRRQRVCVGVVSKTVIMHFHHSNRPPFINPEIKLDDKMLTVVTQRKHLGVSLNKNLTWSAHIDKSIAKACKSLHQLQRTRATLSIDALSCIYKVYIRPTLDHASVVMSSMSRRDSERLERVQRRAARICLRIPLFMTVNHSLLLIKISCPTLYSRRICKSLLLAHSIFFINTHHPTFYLYLFPYARPSPTSYATIVCLHFL